LVPRDGVKANACGILNLWLCCEIPVTEVSHSEPAERGRAIGAWPVHRFLPCASPHLPHTLLPGR
jgi:hypothetical protein